MGYESKIYIVNRHEWELIDGLKMVSGDNIMEIDLAKIGYQGYYNKTFPQLFTNEIDFDLWINNEKTRTDCYDEHCKYGDIDEIIKWVEKMVDDTHYRRAELFLNILKYIKTQQENGVWENVKIVHYGY